MPHKHDRPSSSVYPRHGYAEWVREPDSDIECPICVFEHGNGSAMAYRCIDHPTRPKLIGTRVYRCPRHQQEVQPLMILGEPLLASGLGKWRLLVAPGVYFNG